MSDVRKTTNAVLAAIDEGLLSHEIVAEAALQALSEAEVAEMVRANDWYLTLEDFEDDL